MLSQEKSLHIILVNIGFLPHSVGGTEVYTFNLAKEIMAKGHKVTVFTARNDLAFSQYEIIEETVEDIAVYSVVNSPFFSRSFLDYFLNVEVDRIFKNFLLEKQPDLVHFQHLAYLSGNLQEVAHACSIPSISTIHDYWYLCFRSQLIKPDGSICSGAAEGFNCSTCDDGKSPNPTAVPRYPELVQYINTPNIKKRIEKVLSYMPTELITQARSILFKSLNGGKGVVSNPSIEHLVQNQLRSAHFKRQFEFPEVVISPSHHLKNRYEREGYKNIKVVPLGFYPVEPIEQLPFNDKLKITFLGNLARHKGLHIVLDELLPLVDEECVFELNIYGTTEDSIYLNKIHALAAKFPAGYINFHGRYNAAKDAKAIFSNSHVVVFPSVWEENHPLVLRESLLHGIPVLASSLGGVPEIIQDNVNGWLFNPFEKGQLRSKVSNIINNPDLIVKCSKQALKTEILSMSGHVDMIQDIYYDIATCRQESHNINRN